MKRMGQLMEEIGFQKDAPESVKKAFLKHLFQSASAFERDKKSETDVVGEVSSPVEQNKKLATQPQQLSFDFAQEANKKIG